MHLGTSATRRIGTICLVLALTSGPAAAHATTLTVGPGQVYATPAQAARAARPGDTVRIEPGTYRDCAVWRTDNLTIEGTGAGAVFAGKSCEGKAIFVIHANDVTVRNLTFRGAHVPDGNGAGIRAEGTNLTLIHDRFIGNQDGILTGANRQSTLTVSHSEFIRNGACINACAHGIYAGHIKLLRVEHSLFRDTRVGHHIKSRALRTVLRDNRIEDGPKGTASYEVDIPNGGTLIMIGNVIEKGPLNQNPSAAVTLGEEGITQPTRRILIKDNRFTNDGPPTVFVRNLTRTPALLVGNVIRGNPTTPLTGPGRVHGPSPRPPRKPAPTPRTNHATGE